MRCNSSICALLAVAVVAVQISCNGASDETLNRKKRQTLLGLGVLRSQRGQQRPQGYQGSERQQGYGSEGNSNGGGMGVYSRTSGSGQGNLLSLQLGGSSGSSLSLGSFLNSAIGGSGTNAGNGGSQEANRPSSQFAPSLLPSSSSAATNPAMFGFQAAQNAVNLGGGNHVNPSTIVTPNSGSSQYVNDHVGHQNTGQVNQGHNVPENNFSSGQQSGRPSGQSGRPGQRPSGQQNGRPVVGTEVYENVRPSGGSQGLNSGSGNNNNNNGQQFNQNGGGGGGGNNGFQSNGEETNDRYNGAQGNQGYSQGQGQNHGQGQGQNHGQGQGQGHGQGGGKKKCRGNQYTCQNRECVQRNARCNGISECQDESDELNCNASQNRPGGYDSSNDYATTAAPHNGHTSGSTSNRCILPPQPVGGSYELGSCDAPCNIVVGSRVAASSFLTYRCNEGYNMNGNNVSFCHGGSWYLPPTCVKTCSPLKSNSVDLVCKLHGEIVSCDTAIAPGTKASLACKPSYKIPLTNDPGYRELTCLEEGVWDLTLFRCLPECGTAVSHGNTLIVNGFTAKLGVFPWHVGIYKKNSLNSYDQICAGTLISPDLVISAAHCFYDDTINDVMHPSNYAVGAGKHWRQYNMPEKYVQKSIVKTIEVPSRYIGASGNFAEDISLVRLETPLTLTTLVRPICMDWENAHEREQLQSGQSGKAVGWGKTAEGVPSNELQEINLPYVEYQECLSSVPEEFQGYVTSDKFCAGYLNGSSLCEGDSGGGLCFQLNGLWYLRGVVSVSPVFQNTCDNNYYTAFTNVGRFREWIRAAYVSIS